MKFRIVSCAFIIFFSCSTPTISDKEQKAIKEIVDFYGGKCTSSIGKTISSNGNNNYFELQIENSPVVEEYQKIAELPASNIAYMFFNNSSVDKYDIIKPVLIFSSGKKFEKEFPIKDIKKVSSHMTTLNKAVELVSQKKYSEIHQMLNSNTKELPYDKNKLIEELKRIDSQYGDNKDFIFLGFRFNKIDTHEFLHFSGIMVREKANINFSMDLNTTSNEIIFLSYTL